MRNHKGKYPFRIYSESGAYARKEVTLRGRESKVIIVFPDGDELDTGLTQEDVFKLIVKYATEPIDETRLMSMEAISKKNHRGANSNCADETKNIELFKSSKQLTATDDGEQIVTKEIYGLQELANDFIKMNARRQERQRW